MNRLAIRMAGTEFSPRHLLAILESLPPAPRILVAYSGGLDSSVLLHALAELRPQLAADVEAVHVNHGLSPNARAWEEHCRRVCRALEIRLQVIGIDAHPPAGESPEARARAGRYAALADCMRPGDLMLTAHHQDDQAETLLLQLLRGAGVQGLSGMAPLQPFARGWLARPLLEFVRADLRRFAEAAGLEWVEDESNANLKLSRNYLRHRVLPEIRQRWPGAARVLARSAAHLADAARMVDELAEIDLRSALDPGRGILSVEALQRLPEHRRKAALMRWIRDQGHPPPSAAKLQNILKAVLPAATDRAPVVKWQDTELRRYRGELYLLPPLPNCTGVELSWDLRRAIELPLGTLKARRCQGLGLCAASCTGQPLIIRYRRGGESLRPLRHGHNRRLKKLLQEARIPPWLRERMPLIYLGGELACVPDLWVAESFQAAAHEPAWNIHWSLPARLSAQYAAPLERATATRR